jgi:hypothetical protein
VVLKDCFLELIPIDLATRNRRWRLTGRVQVGVDAALADVAHGRAAEIRSAPALERVAAELRTMSSDNRDPDTAPEDPLQDLAHGSYSVPGTPSLDTLSLTKKIAESYGRLGASGKRHGSVGLHRLLTLGGRLESQLIPILGQPGLHEYRIGYTDRVILQIEESRAILLGVFAF